MGEKNGLKEVFGQKRLRNDGEFAKGIGTMGWANLLYTAFLFGMLQAGTERGGLSICALYWKKPWRRRTRWSLLSASPSRAGIG
jgi:hypothetical protein